MEIGEKIKALRLSQHMTLEALGDKVGVGKSTVRKWENGMIENMRKDKIKKLADALGTTPDYLMGWESYEDSEIAQLRESLEIIKGTHEYSATVEIIKQMGKLNLNGLSKVYDYINDLILHPSYSGGELKAFGTLSEKREKQKKEHQNKMLDSIE